jgi:hypothetical protein
MRKRSLTQRKRSTPTSTRNELLAKQKQQHNAPVKRSETEHKMHILPVEIWENLTVFTSGGLSGAPDMSVPAQKFYFYKYNFYYISPSGLG